MGFEKPPIQGEAAKAEDGPDRFLRLLKKGLEVQFNKIEVIGKENLLKISPAEKVIISPTHISDYDVPLALAFVSAELKREVVVGDASTHHKFGESPLEYLGNVVGGQKHFLPVETKKDEKGVERGKFNPDNFPPMLEALNGGKSVTLSAYYNRSAGWELPERGGIGAAYLAELSDAVIVPVSVDVKSAEEAGKTDAGLSGRLKLIKERPNVSIHIGEPIKLAKVDGIERLAEIFQKRQGGEKLSNEERMEFKTISEKLRGVSDSIMKNLANMLPAEKRGKWEEQEKNN